MYKTNRFFVFTYLTLLMFTGAIVAHGSIAIDFNNMTPHIGQKLEVRVSQVVLGEVDRATLDAIPGAEFMVEFPDVITDGRSFIIDFYADLNQNGVYDSPPTDHAWRLQLDNAAGDTTLEFTHNTSFTDIGWDYGVTVNFSGMNPHVGQMLGIRVLHAESMVEVSRTSIPQLSDPALSVTLGGLDLGENYYVDFFADLNQNGMFDTPPADHAWRLEVMDVQGNVSLDFSHNTSFTMIPWDYTVTVDLKSMNPHLGQLLGVRVVNAQNMREVSRKYLDAIPIANFALELTGLHANNSYYVDFFADLNQNGVYDAPPTDHAWRLEANDVAGDVMLEFTHNTSFTDIMWDYMAKMTLTGMNPHVGQLMGFRVVEQSTMDEVSRTYLEALSGPTETVMLGGLEPGNSYYVDFFADLNQNGVYDAPPTDHAWRLEVNDVDGDVMLDFSHNASFTDIMWDYMAKMTLTGMNPHVGQLMGFRVVEQSTMDEVSRTYLEALSGPTETVMLGGLEPGNSYYVDFFADLNQNGVYDAPPTDHAWRLEVNDVDGDVMLDFSHNASFTNIMWDYLATVQFTGMNPHVGQQLGLRVTNSSDNSEVARTVLASIPGPAFEVTVGGLIAGQSYNVDFYADLNQNGVYDAPPADHAWRLMIENVDGDVTLEFSHNTSFTDIDFETGTDVEVEGRTSIPAEFALDQNFPNPFNPVTMISFALPEAGQVELTIFNTLGQPIRTLVQRSLQAGYHTVVWDGKNNMGVQISSGIYYYAIEAGDFRDTRRMILLK